MRTSSPTVGTLIAGKYRVERVLGQGGMGLVVEATHITLGTRVAVKLLRAEVADADVRERFSREGQIAAQLAGEHIARVTDTGQTQDGDPYLVMEFLVGRDLAAELEARWRLPIAEAVDLILQACEGVAEAHAVGLVHRDIKPANLFLVRRRDGSPLVKVLDFGLSKILNDQVRHLTMTTSSFGTPQYMSPEQIASSKYVDARTDQHALGLVLYELITGTPPYEAPSIPALFVEIATRPAAPMRRRRPEVDSMLDATVLKAMAKSPSDRFSNLAELAAALAPFGSTEGATSAKRIGATLEKPVENAPIRDEPSHNESRRQEPRRSPPPVAAASDDQTKTLKMIDAPNQTVPLIDATVAGTAAVVEPDTHSPLESDPHRSTAKSRRIIALGAAAVVLVLGVIILARGVGGGDPTVDTPRLAASSSEAPAPSAPEVTPGGTVTAVASASASASSAPATSASAASSAKPPSVIRPKSSTGPVDEALRQFWERKGPRKP